jgi:hypothetical protein
VIRNEFQILSYRRRFPMTQRRDTGTTVVECVSVVAADAYVLYPVMCVSAASAQPNVLRYCPLLTWMQSVRTR